MLKLFMDQPQVSAFNEGFEGELRHLHETEKNGEAKSLLRKCIDIVEDKKQ